MNVDEGVEFASLYDARLQSHELLRTIATGGVTVTEIVVSRDVARGCQCNVVNLVFCHVTLKMIFSKKITLMLFVVVIILLRINTLCYFVMIDTMVVILLVTTDTHLRNWCFLLY